MTNHRLIDQDEVPDDVEYDDIDAHERWTFALDEDGDILFDESTQSIPTVSGPQAVKQSLNVALGTPKGEDPLDEDFGLDIFKATGTYRQLEREIRKTINYDDKDHDRVRRIEYVDITQMNRSRKVAVDVSVELDTGEIELLRINIGV